MKYNPRYQVSSTENENKVGSRGSDENSPNPLPPVMVKPLRNPRKTKRFYSYTSVPVTGDLADRAAVYLAVVEPIMRNWLLGKPVGAS